MTKYSCKTEVIVEANNIEEALKVFLDKLNDDPEFGFYVDIEETNIEGD